MNERVGSTQQLIAWCQHIPCVTFEYLEAWAARTKPQDPLPLPSNYVPPSDGHKHWHTKFPKIYGKGGSCWNASTTNSAVEIEHLVQAAGARVISIQEFEEIIEAQ